MVSCLFFIYVFVHSLLWVKRDLWVDSLACMFIPVSIFVRDVGRKREKECVPYPLHGSFRGIFLEHSTLVTLLAACSKNVLCYIQLQMWTFWPIMAVKTALFSHTSSIILLKWIQSDQNTR